MNDYDRFDDRALVAQDAVLEDALLLAEADQLYGIQAEAFVAVDEDRGRELVLDGIDGRDEGERRNKDRVARLHAGFHEAQVKGGCAALAGRDVPGLQELGELLLKLCNIGASGGDPALVDRVIYVFSLIALKVGDGERNKFAHFVPSFCLATVCGGSCGAGCGCAPAGAHAAVRCGAGPVRSRARCRCANGCLRGASGSRRPWCSPRRSRGGCLRGAPGAHTHWCSPGLSRPHEPEHACAMASMARRRRARPTYILLSRDLPVSMCSKLGR